MAALSAAPDPGLQTSYDLSGPLPVESSAWGLAPIPENELPEGAWGPGPGGYDFVYGNWDCPHDGIFLATLLSDGEYTGFEVRAPVVDSGWGWIVFRGEAGERYGVTTARESSLRGLVTVRISELPPPPQTEPAVTGSLPLTVERPFGSWTLPGPGSYTVLWQPIEWVATESRPCVVRCDPGQGVYEITTEVRPGEWERPPGQHYAQTARAIYFHAMAGVRYRIRGSGNSLATPWRVVIDWTSIPANDVRAAATDIGSAEGVFLEGSNRLATLTPEEALLFSGTGVDRVVWGRWTAPSAGTRMMTTSESWLVTRIFVESAGQLVPVSRVEVPGTAANFSFQAEAGVTHFFGFGSRPGTQVYEWNWGITKVPAPPVDPAATPLRVVRSLGSRREAAEYVRLPAVPAGQNRVVEWEWTAPCASQFTVQSFTPKVAILQRDAAGLESLAASEDWLPLTHQLFSVEAGVTYVFRNQPSARTEFFIHLRPFAAILHLTPETAGDLGDELPAHGQAMILPSGEPSWWKWTAPMTGVISLPFGRGWVAAYDENLEPLPAPAFYAHNGEPAIQFMEVRKGQRYYFARYASSSPVEMVEINLRRTLVTRPPNDNFSSAADLGSDRLVKWTGRGHGEVTGWTRPHSSANIERDELTLSSLEKGEPAHRPEIGGSKVMGSLWWRWTAPRTEKVRLQGLGMVRLFTGDSLPGLVRMATFEDSDPDGERAGVAFMATAGTTYHIASLRDANLSASIELWLFAPAPRVLNDAFADRVHALVTDSPDVFAFAPAWLNPGAATLEPGEPAPPVFYPGAGPLVSTWWRWRCLTSGFYRFSNGSSEGPVTGRIFQGESLAGLQENPLSEQGDFAAIAGREYAIVRYHRAVEGLEDTTVLQRVNDHPYAVWAGQFSLSDEADLLESANPSGDGLSNALKFFCGLNPALNSYGGTEPNAGNAPQLITTASGVQAIRYQLHWPNFALGSDSYWYPCAWLQSSADLLHWEEVYPQPNVSDTFTNVVLPAPVSGSRRYYRLQFGLFYNP